VPVPAAAPDSAPALSPPLRQQQGAEVAARTKTRSAPTVTRPHRAPPPAPPQGRSRSRSTIISTKAPGTSPSAHHPKLRLRLQRFPTSKNRPPRGRTNAGHRTRAVPVQPKRRERAISTKLRPKTCGSTPVAGQRSRTDGYCWSILHMRLQVVPGETTPSPASPRGFPHAQPLCIPQLVPPPGWWWTFMVDDNSQGPARGRLVVKRIRSSVEPDDSRLVTR